MVFECTRVVLQSLETLSACLSIHLSQGFMTAVKQTFSRDYKIAIDTLTVTSRVMEYDETVVKPAMVPKDGVLIHGMHQRHGSNYTLECTVSNFALP